MQRSDFLIKLISILLLVAITLYLGLNFLMTRLSPMTTTLAVRASAERSGSAVGWAVRDETVLSGGGSTVSVTCGEGAHVAAGDTIAVRYSGESAMERASGIVELKRRIEQLESVGASASSKRDNALISVTSLSAAVRSGDFDELESRLLDVETYVFKSGDTAETESQLASLRSQLSELQAQSNTGATSITAPASGTFSSVADGFESVTPDMLTGLTPDSLEALFSSPGAVAGDALGKLVYGTQWYFASVTSEDDAERIREAVIDSETGEISPYKTVTVEFTRAYDATLQMNVVSVGEAAYGKCVVVFSCKRGLADAIAERSLTAEVVFESASGIRVPREALHSEDGADVVYITTGLQAERVEIDILAEYDDYVIAADGAVTGSNLREGAEIIVRANDLYDGKVIRQ